MAFGVGNMNSLPEIVTPLLITKNQIELFGDDYFKDK
jgi:hypothetical protein